MISIVLATYNRPETLRVAIRSVQLQTRQDWELIVLGDACDGRTAEVIAEFVDPRIAYVNLSARCGDQAIPNSIGMALARGEFIALLNHDDVLLADHLALGVQALEASGADLFSGKAAFARFSGRLPDGRLIPAFAEVSPRGRQLRDVFAAGAEMFEPCSAWVFRRAVFDTVGPWRPAGELFRSPMEDWLLRAWRSGVRLVAGESISVLRVVTHYRQPDGRPAYQHDPGEHAWLDGLIRSRSAEEIRMGIERDLDSGAMDRVPRLGFRTLLLKLLEELSEEQERLAMQLLTPAAADEYLETGRDAFEQFCRQAGIDRGYALAIVLRKRTGEEPRPPPDAARLLAEARRALRPESG
jgi:glycosyltransferase involved in cell wall biosynthesis